MPYPRKLVLNFMTEFVDLSRQGQGQNLVIETLSEATSSQWKFLITKSVILECLGFLLFLRGTWHPNDSKGDLVWHTTVRLPLLERYRAASIEITLVGPSSIFLLEHHKFHVKYALASGSIVLRSREELGCHPRDVT